MLVGWWGSHYALIAESVIKLVKWGEGISRSWLSTNFRHLREFWAYFLIMLLISFHTPIARPGILGEEETRNYFYWSRGPIRA